MGRVLAVLAVVGFAAPAAADEFPAHRVAVGLGGPQLSLGLFGRVYLVGPFFAQAATYRATAGGERATVGVLSLGARVHSTEKTALLVRGGLRCSVFQDVDATDNHVPEPDGCLHFLAGFAAEARLFWRVSTSVGATMGWSPEIPSWVLLPEIELSVHI